MRSSGQLGSHSPRQILRLFRVTYDTCSLIRRPLDGALRQLGLIPAKGGEPLRKDNRWK
jgi:hypothetical protein